MSNQFPTIKFRKLSLEEIKSILKASTGNLYVVELRKGNVNVYSFQRYLGFLVDPRDNEPRNVAFIYVDI